jgi:hypothetical protein
LAITMVLEWREREHEEDNAIAENHPATIAALRDCGLLKFFRILGMRAQVRVPRFRQWVYIIDL